MKDSLKQAIADSPDKQFERYPAGSIVLCNACALPIFKLDFAITLGMKGGQASNAFKPIKLADLLELEQRPDIDAGVRAALKAWSPEKKKAHLELLFEPRRGEAMICPICGGCYPQVLTTEVNETNDRAYTLELLTIPPVGYGRPTPVRGIRFDRGGWIHGRKH